MKNVRFVDGYTSMKLNVVSQEVAYVERIACSSVTVTAKDKHVKSSARVSVCKKGCGRLYRDWFNELVCPVCGYHEYSEEESLVNHKHSRLC